MRPSRMSGQQSGCGSARNVASHRHRRSLARQVGNGLSAHVAPKKREEAAVEASCHFLKQLQKLVRASQAAVSHSCAMSESLPRAEATTPCAGTVRRALTVGPYLSPRLAQD